MTEPAQQFRVVAPDDAAFPVLGRIWSDAYPGLGLDGPGFTAMMRERHVAGTRVVTLEENGAPVGAIALYDLTMNVRGRDARTAGLGSLAVSLAHKRRGIARAIVRWSLDDARRNGATFAALYPFRPDYYRALGFGYGTPTYRFRFAPGTLRDEGARGAARLLDEADAAAIAACHERIRIRLNGLMALRVDLLTRNLANPALRYVGVDDGDGALRGYLWTQVVPGPAGTTNRNELVVRDVLYEDESAFAALLRYLRSQSDQFAAIVVETQDAAFFLAARDPRDGSDGLVAMPAVHRIAETGLGIMYRILDATRAFAHLGPVETPFALRVEIDDPFGESGGAATFRFGRYAAPQRDDQAHPDALLRIGIADLSSLVMGALDLRALVRHRAAALDPDVLLDRIDRAFRPDERPICTTRF